ncbi:MAG: hypothetical protein ACHP8B_17005 [Terriglobales bacterium]
MRKLLISMLLLGGFIHPLLAHAGAALLVEEPYGKFGSGVPTGHSAIYLPQVCATTPTELRRCNPGELGVVISRYHHVAGRDWLAIPVIPYLYAVDRIEDVPAATSEETVRALRDEYRRAHLLNLVPDAPDGGIPKGDWTQLVGSSYDRQIYVYYFATTPAQDEKLIALLNSKNNRSHFNLFYRNCADFSRKIINFYHPGATRRNPTADLGITTPKQLAKSLAKYGQHHERLDLTTAVIAQVPGSVERSHTSHGVVESLLKTKKYAIPLAPLAVVHPFFAAGVVVTYFFSGRFGPPKSAEVLSDPEQVQLLAQRYAGAEEEARDQPELALGTGIPAEQLQSGCTQGRVDLPARRVSCFVNTPEP